MQKLEAYQFVTERVACDPSNLPTDCPIYYENTGVGCKMAAYALKVTMESVATFETDDEKALHKLIKKVEEGWHHMGICGYELDDGTKLIRKQHMRVPQQPDERKRSRARRWQEVNAFDLHYDTVRY